MTELEKIERAKMYMDKLANGINPIDDTMVPDEDIINNVRLSRCFFFVSDVLRQVIENGRTNPIAVKRPQKLPLEIPFEKRCQFDYSEKPIPASEIARRVNNLADNENMKKLTYSSIFSWLADIGRIEEVSTSNGKHIKRPTEIGRENGISVEDRISNNGPYQVVVYSTAAQHFIMDNLDAIVAMANNQGKMQGTPWTQEHDNCLVDLYQKSVPLSEIAVTLKRSVSAIRKRLRRLGFDLP